MNLNNDIFNINLQLTETKKGTVLISEPFLQDMYFQRSVIFLTEHDKTGSIGFIINKSIPMKISEVLKNFPNVPVNVGLGGPVKTNTVHYIHTLGDLVPESNHVLDNIYWGGNFDAIKDLAQKKIATPENTRFFIGYSGWSPKQLEEEISKQSWIVTKIDTSKLFKPTTTIWEDLLKNLGEHYKIWLNAPPNPMMN